ncbi:MAG: hypothetical protein CO034_02795 [Parcubacteria group bacterium CG_4_9_14_0_2_um_filter_35_11]|nr:tetrahydromethanopterin S-methyltransferase subunit A [bacterium]PIU42797.1 MAG: hypothetical protein COS98_01045 [Parcubacteria group bacterium CG07_land_8_20_14_0_80_35_11]PJC47351.1 MAG: hypothetical protein CO034_02795 [Parcubacteria group bacterium CG_4_9_14_0_2_um_filter_35_11]
MKAAYQTKADLKNWPPIEGRYKVGNKNSPVAVCTNASIDEIKVDLKKVAIIGKCVTENIGIEKIIQNIASNPSIRYLVLCGRDSKGHFVAQAIEALLKNGVDKEKRIVGAKGNMPYLKNLDKKVIETFRTQIKIINLVGETSPLEIEKIIDEILKTKREKFQTKAVKIKKVKEIEAKSVRWVSDPNGYFLVTLDKGRRKIIVEHYKEGKINKKILGNNAKEICDTVAKLNLIGNFGQKLEHAMYLARELEKAEIALKNNINFEQDSELNITSGKVEQGEKTNDEYNWHD